MSIDALEPLTVRDAAAANVAEVLQFARPELSAKPRAVPEGPFGQLCVSGLANEEWSPLLQMAADFGFPSA